MVVVVPAAAAFGRGFNPFGLAGGFGVAVAENHVGAAPVPIADAGAVELRDDVGEDHVKEVIRIGRRAAKVDVDEGGTVAEGDHVGRGDDAVVRSAAIAFARSKKVAAETEIQRRWIAFCSAAMVVTVVRVDIRVVRFDDIEVLIGGSFELRAAEDFGFCDGTQGALPIAEAIAGSGEGERVLIFDVEMEGDGDLAEVAQALGLAPAAFGAGQGGQKKAGKDCDNGDDDEKLG